MNKRIVDFDTKLQFEQELLDLVKKYGYISANKKYISYMEVIVGLNIFPNIFVIESDGDDDKTRQIYLILIQLKRKIRLWKYKLKSLLRGY